MYSNVKILHCQPFQSTIHTLDGRGQFHHHDPTVSQINHTYNQHHHLNCQHQFRPLLIRITHRATQPVIHWFTQLTTHLPTHLIPHLLSHPATQGPTFMIIHIMTLLIQKQNIRPILQLLTHSEQKQPEQKELDIVQRIQNSVM